MAPGSRTPSIDPSTADARRRSTERPSPVLLDVREADEHRSGRPEGAVLAPLSTLASRLGEIPRDRPIFVICHSGGRSATVTDYLLANGWTDVFNVGGGMIAWERAGLRVRSGLPEAAEYELPP